MLKKRIVKKILAVIVVTIAIAEISLVVSHFVNFSGKKSKIVEELKDNFGGNASIKGKVYFKLFPVPKFVLTHLRLYDAEAGLFTLDLRAPEVSFQVSPLSFLFGSIDVSDIEIKNAKIEFKMAWLESKERGKIGRNFDHVTIVDSDLIIANDRFKLYKEFNNLNIAIQSTSRKKVKLIYEGSFESMLNKFEFKAKMKEQDDFSVLVNSDFKSTPKNSQNHYQDISVNFKTDTRFYIKDASLTNNVTIKGNDIQHFIFNHIYRAPIFFPDKTTNDFTADLKINFKNGLLSISDVNLKSSPITGNMNLDFDFHGNGKAKIDILSMSFDELLTDKTKEYANYEVQLLDKDDQLKFSLLPDATFELDIHADELIIAHNQLSDLETKFTFKGSDKKLFDLSFTNYDANNVNATGEIVYNKATDSRNVIGNVESNGKDFSLFLRHFLPSLTFVREDAFKAYRLLAKFNFAQDLFSLTDIKAKIDDFSLMGDVVVRDIEGASSNNVSNSKVSLTFNNLNFDEYYLYDNAKEERHFIDFIYSVIANKRDSKTLFQRFLWLRNIVSEVTFDIFVDQFIYGQKQNENMLISGFLKHRLLAINDFSIFDKDDDFNGKFSVDIGDIPKITFDLTGKKINLDNFRYPKKADQSGHVWSKEVFRLPRLTSMVTDFNVMLDQIIYGKLLVRDLVLKTDFRKGTLYFDEFTGKIFDKGSFNIQGYYIISGLPTLSMAFQFANLELGKFFDFLFDNGSFNTIASVSGNINTFGQSLSVFIKQLSANLKYRTGKIVVKNFGVGSVVDYIANLTKLDVYKKKFDLAENLSKGVSVYKPIEGDFIIRKGKGVINNLSLKKEGMNSNVIGKIDIPAYQLFISTIHVFRAYYLSGENVENASLRVDYRLQGAFNDLTSSLDGAQVEKLTEDLHIAYKPIIERNKKILVQLEKARKKLAEELERQKQDEDYLNE